MFKNLVIFCLMISTLVILSAEIKYYDKVQRSTGIAADGKWICYSMKNIKVIFHFGSGKFIATRQEEDNTITQLTNPFDIYIGMSGRWFKQQNGYLFT